MSTQVSSETFSPPSGEVGRCSGRVGCYFAELKRSAMTRQTARQTSRARSLRTTQTPADGLLWRVLRGSQLCDWKFRQRFLVGKGWRVVRINNQDVSRDVEPVLRAIASSVDVDFWHQRRSDHLGGMLGDIFSTSRPTRPLPRPTSPLRWEVKMCRHQWVLRGSACSCSAG